MSGTVVRVIDGDTLDVRLSGGKIDRVRVLGIDSPEMRPRERCATQATAAARRIAQGRRVGLIGDSSQATRDRYRRLLAYVTLPSGSDLGRQLLTMGLATVYVFDKPFARVHAYRQAQGLAKKKRFGLLGPAPQRRPSFQRRRCGPRRRSLRPQRHHPDTTAILPGLPMTRRPARPRPPRRRHATTTTGPTPSGPPPPPAGGNATRATRTSASLRPRRTELRHLARNFRVRHDVADPDPHRFDGNKDGWACEN